MCVLAEIVDDREVDWLGAVSDPRPLRRIADLVDLSLEERVLLTFDRFALVYGADSVGTRGRHSGKDGPLSLGRALVAELYDLLCADKKYNDARAKLAREARPGETFVVTLIASSIASQLGTAVAPTAAAVAVALGTIGKIGLNAWCASQSAWRRTLDPD